MGHVMRELRQSLRSLAKERMFTATVLTTLALCLGANIAIFSVIYSVVLEPLPFPNPDRLVTVTNSYPGAGVPRASNGSADYFQRRENVAAFEEVAVFQGFGNTVGDPGSTQRIASLRVTPSFFRLFGIEPAMGRGFVEEEMDPGSHEKVVLTHGLWQELFGGAPDVVGRDLRINARPYEIVGEARLLIPIEFPPEARTLDSWHNNNFSMMARLVEGATVEQARAQNLALNESLIEQWNQPNARQLLTDVGYTTLVFPAASDMVRDVKPVLFMLWAGVVLVLLIGCVNIANLVLARAQTRVSEVATKLALGAARSRVAGQVFVEAVVLGGVGGVLGLGLGAVGLRLLTTLGAADLPRGTEVGIDLPIVAFAMGLAIAAGILFSIIPVVQVMRGDLSPVFRAGGRTGTASRRSVFVRNALVTGQVGLAFVMLIGAGLMLMSFRAALSVDPGFDPDGLLTGLVSIPAARYEDGDAMRQFWDQLLADVRATPAVESASLTSQLPFGGNNSSSVITPEGYVPPAGESLLSPFQTVAGPDYFETMGIELVAGRAFEESDGPESPNVIVIDQWLADRYWPGGNALGDRVVYGVVPGADSVPEENLFTVVGIVETIKQNDLTTPASEHVGAYYFTYRQQPRTFFAVTARSKAGDGSELVSPLRAALSGVDRDVPLFGVETMSARLDESLARRRQPLLLLVIFAGLALFLVVVGIYGALAYTVSQRTKEIGIRMAMGSAPQQVFRTVVGQGLRVTALGLALGGLAAYFVTRLLESLLFGVAAADARVMVAVALLLTGVAATACSIPARRATRVNPVEALEG
jgi:predicted permease